jgi:hypothetical protein
LIFGIPTANEKVPAAISAKALFQGAGGIDGSNADVEVEKAIARVSAVDTKIGKFPNLRKVLR